jgi:hypothetical protein
MAQLVVGAVGENTRFEGYRHFQPHGCVHAVGGRRQVFVGGTLVGCYDVSDKVTRNALVVELSQEPRVHLGQLARAFELCDEQVRQLRRRHEAEGLASVLEVRRGGRKPVVTPGLRKSLHGLFEAGLSIERAHADRRIRGRVSRAVVGRERKAWGEQRRAAEAIRVSPATDQERSAPRAQVEVELAVAPAPATPVVSTSAAAQVPLAQASREESSAEESPQEQLPQEELTSECESEPAEVAPAGSDFETPVAGNSGAASQSLHTARELPSGVALDGRRQYVQHAGSWILLALMHASGLYQRTEALRLAAIQTGDVDGRHLGATALRVALDAAIIAIGIGQGCMEGVRRLATPTARTLFRIGQALPPPAWVRQVLRRLACARGQVLHVATMLALIQRAQREDEPRAWYYVDNHMRPYTGKHVIRKGWRMQDKRVRPGSSDYWVHDEDGRPLLRVASPSHEPMTTRLRPIARMLRLGLDEAGAKDTKVALVFDRAGAFPTEMAAVRDEGFEFVTYERAPYSTISATAFDSKITVRGEVLRYVELAKKNLRGGRGRVRRIHVLAENEEQFNIVACSDAPAQELIVALLDRWGKQENQFKHGVERFGLNQLDGRTVQPVSPDENIPNPARRRLQRALSVARQLEGEALRRLAHLPMDDPKRRRWEQELTRSRTLQAELEAQRPDVPEKVRVGDSELADKLVRHQDDYKLLLDTLRLLAANVESELATTLGPHLARPAEAKKTLANLFAAPAVVHATSRAIVVNLAPAGTRRELRAFRALLTLLTAQRLTLPGDPTRRPLCFRTQVERDGAL